MNERKLKKLFESVRAEVPPAPAEDFEQAVLRVISCEAAAPTASLLEQLNLLFPRLALGALCLIALCVAGDWLAGAAQLPSLTDGVAQLSQQWLLTGEGF
jgi:hypothetical protein